MAEIVLVHGIAQEQLSADSLEKDWLPALAGGVRNAGFHGVADQIWRGADGFGRISARMAFYGNLFLIADQQGADPGKLSPAEAVLAEALAMEWLKRVAERATKEKIRQTGSREWAYVAGQMGTEQGAGGFARSAIASLAKISWFAPFGMCFAARFINRSLAQVTMYLTDEVIRSAALESVSRLIGTETKVLIGHSLGSIVAYEAAHRLQQSLPLLVTLGSPLGLQNVIYHRLRPQPPAFPPNVRRWVNVADRDDFIAAEPDLTGFFSAGIPVDAVFEGRYTVDNGADPHNAGFYLGKVEVGKSVGEAVSNGGAAS
jgi:hypothetical protein